MNALDIENYLENLVKEGKVKRIGLEIMDAIQNFTLDEDNTFDNSYIADAYRFYLNLLSSLENYQGPFLKALKHEEIKRNQALENVDPFLIQVFINSHHKSSTNYAIREKANDHDLTSLDLRRMHRILLNGLTKDDNTKSLFREDNTSFVGKWNNKSSLDQIEEISYLPIDYKEIPEAVDFILKLYNTRNLKDDTNIFLIPIFLHGLLAALQIFRDGNTRLARILANVQLWDLTNHCQEYPTIEAPALYISEILYGLNQRAHYRHLIKNIAINPNNETLNAWVKFNLNLIEKQIYLNQKRIENCSLTLTRKNNI